MYVPTAFRLDDVERCHDLIQAHPLGALVTLGADGLEANHVPFVLHAELGEKGTLRAHLARANEQWTRFDPATPALVIFRAADGYVTPSWYPSKAEHGKVVPTWNYVVVHARGRLRLVEDDAWLQTHLESLTTSREAQREHPWAVSDAPTPFVGQLKRAIIGLEIEISDLAGKVKVSQNRPEPDRAAVYEAMQRAEDADSQVMASFLRPYTRG